MHRAARIYGAYLLFFPPPDSHVPARLIAGETYAVNKAPISRRVQCSGSEVRIETLALKRGEGGKNERGELARGA